MANKSELPEDDARGDASPDHSPEPEEVENPPEALTVLPERRLKPLKGGELALETLGADAEAHLERFAKNLEQLRLISIRLTQPHDWLLYRQGDPLDTPIKASEAFKMGHGITCYLQDQGCMRLLDLWQIQLFDISDWEHIEVNPRASKDGRVLRTGASVPGRPRHYGVIQTGSGASARTMQVIEKALGQWSSEQDNCLHLSGLELERVMRKSCRANLQGTIVRQLTGLKNIGVQWLVAAWGTEEHLDKCVLARGWRPPVRGGKISAAQVKRMFALANQAGWGKPNEDVPKLCAKHGFKSPSEVTRDRYREICDIIQGGGE